MLNKKNIITLFFSLFVFFSTSGFGSSIDANQRHNRQTGTTGDISQSSDSNDNKSITSIDGILQTSIKVNESNSPTFENLKNGKKSFILNSHLLSFKFSKRYYTFYCLNRINRIKVSPFYIAYHRLII